MNSIIDLKKHPNSFLIIAILLLITIGFNDLKGQSFNQPDTLKEADVFGSRNMKMLVIDGIGKDQRKLDKKKDLSLYFNFSENITTSKTEGLVTKCLEYYESKIHQNEFKVDISFTKEKKVNDLSELNHILKLLTKKDIEQDESKKYKIKKYLVLLQKNKITPTKLYRTKKAIMMGNPILIEANIDNNIFSISNDSFWSPSDYPSDKLFTILLIGYDAEQAAFQGVIGNGNKIWITFDDFMEHVTQGYVIIP